MVRDLPADQIDKEHKKLKDEQLRVKDQMAELETKAKAYEAEIRELEEKRRRAEERAKLEAELKMTFSELLKLNTQTIPGFLNECYTKLADMAAEYDKLTASEADMFGKFESLKKRLTTIGRTFDSIQEEVQEQVGSPVELTDDLKHLLRLIIDNRAVWTRDAAVVLRFLDTRREIPQMKW